MGQYVIYSYQDKYHAGYFSGPEFKCCDPVKQGADILHPEGNGHGKQQHRKPGADAIETGEENR
jgi:hypothetical protein